MGYYGIKMKLGDKLFKIAEGVNKIGDVSSKMSINYHIRLYTNMLKHCRVRYEILDPFTEEAKEIKDAMNILESSIKTFIESRDSF